MWMYAIVKMQGGVPAIDAEVTPYHGHVHIAQRGQYGLYQVSGTKSALQAIAATADVVPLVAVTDDGVVKHPEMDDPVLAAIRSKLNAWLTAAGKPNIPTGWTYRRLIQEIADVFEVTKEDFDGCWVTDT